MPRIENHVKIKISSLHTFIVDLILVEDFFSPLLGIMAS
jgi:hypothetical protein